MLSLGSLGLGLVWGWLLGHINQRGTKNGAAAGLLLLFAASGLMAWHTSALVGVKQLPWVFCALICAYLSHWIFCRQITKHIDDS
jgi:ABC-type uncharacterized transport system permease subunit